MTNILVVYPEISYFHSAYFDTLANAANVAAFSSVKLYNDEASTTTNYEFLF